jgi:hypothetical protein
MKKISPATTRSTSSPASTALCGALAMLYRSMNTFSISCTESPQPRERKRRAQPGPNQSRPMRATNSVAPNVVVSFSGSQNISLWDYDSGSRDDHLGSITILEEEKGYELFKLASSPVEGSAYYVHYRVY